MKIPAEEVAENQEEEVVKTPVEVSKNQEMKRQHEAQKHIEEVLKRQKERADV